MLRAGGPPLLRQAYRRRAGPCTFLLPRSSPSASDGGPRRRSCTSSCLVSCSSPPGGGRRLAPRHVARAGDGEPTCWVALALTAGGALVGSMPWWYANAHTGFASLQRSSFPANGGATYGARLSVFFHYTLPMQLGVRTVLRGTWVGGPAIGKLLYAVMLAPDCRGRHPCGLDRRSTVRAEFVPLALAVAVVVYPFLYAAAPGTAYWNDGRYGIYLPALVVVLFATVLATALASGRQRLGDGSAPVQRDAARRARRGARCPRRRRASTVVGAHGPPGCLPTSSPAGATATPRCSTC